MAHLWMTDDDNNWGYFPLLAGDEAYSLENIPPTPTVATPETAGAGKPLLVRARDGCWVLLCGDAGARINGLPSVAGVRALRHKDRVDLPALGAMYLSMENLPQVEPFSGDKARKQCPRCCKPIKEGAPAMRCPGCGVWYHQSDERPCATIGPTCLFCPQSTDLEAGFRFVPEAL